MMVVEQTPPNYYDCFVDQRLPLHVAAQACFSILLHKSFRACLFLADAGTLACSKLRLQKAQCEKTSTNISTDCGHEPENVSTMIVGPMKKEGLKRIIN